MSDLDDKTGSDNGMQVSEAEVEAFPVPAEQPPGGGSNLAPPPPPLPRRRAARPRAVLLIGVAALCAIAGLGIGFLWNRLHGPAPEPAASAAKPVPAAAAPAPVEIRLEEMVVTSGAKPEAK